MWPGRFKKITPARLHKSARLHAGTCGAWRLCFLVYTYMYQVKFIKQIQALNSIGCGAHTLRRLLLGRVIVQLARVIWEQVRDPLHDGEG